MRSDLEVTIQEEQFMIDNFCIRYTDHPSKQFSVRLSDLMKDSHLDEFINFYGPTIKAVQSDVVATYFCGYYGWALAGMQYALSLDLSYDMALSNIELQVYFDEQYDYHGLHFKFINSSTITCKKEDREAWCRQELTKAYRECMTPLLQVLSKKTNLSMKHLWGQIAIGLYNGYDQNVELAQEGEQKSKIKHDFTLLTKELEAEVFHMKKNPFDMSVRKIESAKEPGVYMRMKPSCCLYYQTEGADTKCYSCPRLSDEEREKKKLAIKQSESA